MGAELQFTIGVIGLGILSTVMLSIAVFTFQPPEVASVCAACRHRDVAALDVAMTRLRDVGAVVTLVDGGAVR